jgi:hypothetical protein
LFYARQLLDIWLRYASYNYPADIPAEFPEKKIVKLVKLFPHLVKPGFSRFIAALSYRIYKGAFIF